MSSISTVRELVAKAKAYYPQSRNMRKQFVRQRMALEQSGKYVFNAESPVSLRRNHVLRGAL